MFKEGPPKDIHETRIENLTNNILYAIPRNRKVMENFQSSEALTMGIRDLVRANVIISYAGGNKEYQIEQNGVKSLISLGISRIWGTNDAISSIIEKKYPFDEKFPEDQEEIFSRNIALLTSLGLDLSLISKS